MYISYKILWYWYVHKTLYQQKGFFSLWAACCIAIIAADTRSPASVGLHVVQSTVLSGLAVPKSTEEGRKPFSVGKSLCVGAATVVEC